MPKVPGEVVPFKPGGAPAPQLDPTAVWMAAAMMHTEGKFQSMTTVPMPKDVFDGIAAGGRTTVEDGDKVLGKYEATVDKHIKDNKLNAGDRFKVDHPDGPRIYEYLGPDSGGRKDWREVPKQKEMM